MPSAYPTNASVAIVPALAMLVLYVAAGLRRDEERYADAVSPASAPSLP